MIVYNKKNVGHHKKRIFDEKSDNVQKNRTEASNEQYENLFKALRFHTYNIMGLIYFFFY